MADNKNTVLSLFAQLHPEGLTIPGVVTTAEGATFDLKLEASK